MLHLFHLLACNVYYDDEPVNMQSPTHNKPPPLPTITITRAQLVQT